MRLACPNCDAKYEVPDDAIPEAGRDVQCSNCGHAWFQMRPEAELAAEEEAALYGDDLPPAEAPDAAPEGPAQASVPEALTPQDAADDGPDLAAAVAAAVAAGPAAMAAGAAAAAADSPTPEEDEDYDEDDAGSAAPVPPAAARGLDDAVLSVLREEAEREAEARRHEVQRADQRRAEAEGQMQTQPDLGMGEPAPPAALTPTQRRLAMLRGEDPDALPPEPARPPARRDLLPDVEEINSTLQPSEGDGNPDDDVDALPDLTRSRFGFRTGFLLVFLVLVAAAVVYVAAPGIAELAPGLKPTLDSYVTFVDALRVWLDGAMNSATRAISGSSE
jgi:predicted Zn finger-like uncharacterized protein